MVVQIVAERQIQRAAVRFSDFSQRFAGIQGSIYLHMHFSEQIVVEVQDMNLNGLRTVTTHRKVAPGGSLGSDVHCREASGWKKLNINKDV